MINSYYRSEPDSMYEKLSRDKTHTTFYTDCREYLLEQYGCNLSQFIELCPPCCSSIDYWQQLAEADVDPKRTIDDLAQDEQGERQQRYVNGIVISSAAHHQ
jgi:hypothetical protein